MLALGPTLRLRWVLLLGLALGTEAFFRLSSLRLPCSPLLSSNSVSGHGNGMRTRFPRHDHDEPWTTRLYVSLNEPGGEGGEDKKVEQQGGEEEEPKDLMGKFQKYMDKEENRKDAMM